MENNLSDEYVGKFILDGALYSFNEKAGKLEPEEDGKAILRIKDLQRIGDQFTGSVDHSLNKFRIHADLIERYSELQPSEIEALNQTAIQQGFGAVRITKEMAEQLTGKPMRVYLDGLNYIVDTTNLRIVQVKDPSKFFSLTEEAFHHKQYLSYDPITKTPLNDWNLNQGLLVEFPKLLNYDPIGYCIRHDFPPYWLVAIGKVEEDHSIKILGKLQTRQMREELRVKHHVLPLQRLERVKRPRLKQY